MVMQDGGLPLFIAIIVSAAILGIFILVAVIVGVSLLPL
jgi:hypothetical protein